MGILLFILLSVTVLCSLLVKSDTQPLAIASGSAGDSGEQDKVLEQPNIGKEYFYIDGRKKLFI